jgi:uncharacterized protein YtpQ (UPF0354 family)
MTPTKLTTFIHPDKAYKVEYPAHWERLEKDEGRSCGFGPRDRDDVGLWISIMPMSIDTDRLKEELPKLFEQSMQKTEGTNARRDTALQCFGLKADMTKPGEGGHYWMLAGGDLVLFASSQVPPAERDIWNPQFDRLMASLEITRHRELVLRKAADSVIERLRELHPEQDYEFDDAGIRGRDHRISLVNLYKQVESAAPARRQRIIEQFTEGLAYTAEHPPGQEPLEEARDRILPVLKPTAYLKAGTPTESLATSEWLGDVVICYAIRDAKIFRFLTNWDLNRWGITLDALHDLSIKNLARLPWPERLEGARQSGGRLIIVATNDNFDASRLLHPDLHRLFSGPLGSPFYAGIPDRDTLVAFSSGNRSLRQHTLRQMRRDHDRSAYPITPRPFLVTADGIALAKL